MKTQKHCKKTSKNTNIVKKKNPNQITKKLTILRNAKNKYPIHQQKTETRSQKNYQSYS